MIRLEGKPPNRFFTPAAGRKALGRARGWIPALILAAFLPGAFPARARSIQDVSDFMKSYRPGSGTARVEGVVASAWPKKGLLTLIDEGEWRACGDVHCAEYVLPVRWKGPFPPVRETVLIRGRVARVGGKRVFVAFSLEKIPSKKAAPK